MSPGKTSRTGRSRPRVARATGGSTAGEIGLEALDPGVELDAERVQRHRHRVVLAYREDEVQELLRVVVVREVSPGGVRDARNGVQLVGRTQHGRLESGPSRKRLAPRQRGESPPR